MEDDIKYEFQKIAEAIDRIKRGELSSIKEKLSDFNAQELKYALNDIKDRLDKLESKIQK